MKLLVLLVALAACSEGKKPEPKREPERPRRVIEPPTRVRALPPFAIRADGVGPYKLGATVTQLLEQLPSGPRITQFALPEVIQRDILRAEEDAILIGTEPQGKATFVSVVKPEIARTESGVHVGSTREQLEEGLGPPLEDPYRAHDDRIVIPSKLDNARAVFQGDRIVALVIAAEPDKGKEPKNAGEPRDDAEIEKAKSMLGRLYGPALVFAAALRNPNDGKDDIIAITRNDDATTTRTWSITGYRWHEGKPQRVIDEKVVYELTAANARWIGAELGDLELYIELQSRGDSIEVGGLLTTRKKDGIRDIVVISPKSVGRKRTKAIPHESIDAGTSDTR